MRTLIAAVGVLLVAAPAAASVPLSVQDEAAITCDGWGLRDAALEAAKELGATVIRVNLIEWNNCPGAASAATAIAAAGLRPQLTLVGSPVWIKAQVLRDRALVSTYAIWNEPDLLGWHCCRNTFPPLSGEPLGNPAAYRAAYPRGYRIVKSLDPGAKVLFGEFSPHSMGHAGEKRWIRQVLRPGRPLRADGIAIHPYAWYWSPKVGRAYYRELAAFKRVVGRWARRRMLVRPGGGRVPIYNTEYGQVRSDGLSGDGGAASRSYRYSTRLGFRQHSQYMVFPAFDEDRSTDPWNTAVTDDACRPSPAYFALRRAVTGRVDHDSEVRWPSCPAPIPGVSEPKPPGYGTPAYKPGEYRQPRRM